MKKIVLLTAVLAGTVPFLSIMAETQTEVVSTDVLQLKPRAKYLPDPVYPAELKKKGIAGAASVEFVITEKGEVTEIKVIQASNPAFGDAAKEAVSKAKFHPGIGKDGQAVSVRLQVPFKFDPKK